LHKYFQYKLQASQALHYQDLSQAKSRLDFEVQACSSQGLNKNFKIQASKSLGKIVQAKLKPSLGLLHP